MKIFKSKNIVSLLISFLIIFSGTIPYAIAHNSCISDGIVHTDCVDDCCKKDICCDENDLSYFAESKECCEIHQENSNQEISLKTLIKVSQKKVVLVSYSFKSVENTNSIQSDRNFSNITHIPDINILYSNLRI